MSTFINEAVEVHRRGGEEDLRAWYLLLEEDKQAEFDQALQTLAGSMATALARVEAVLADTLIPAMRAAAQATAEKFAEIAAPYIAAGREMDQERPEFISPGRAALRGAVLRRRNERR
jgi:hypothetical protein